MTADDEWEVDGLDLEDYLDRIRYRGARAPVAETLFALHRAHVAAVPFENLDVLLGRAIPLDLASVQQKLVHHERGGYCYEHGVLMGAALERLGFQVTRVLGRVGDQRVRATGRTHMALIVDVGSVRYLADPGFGNGLLEPVPLGDGVEQQQGEWRFRLSRADATHWRLAEWTDRHGWSALHEFGDEPQHLPDLRLSNHFTMTWPESRFVLQAIVLRRDERETRRLVDGRFDRWTPRGTNPHRDLGPGELGAVLAGLGIRLPTADLEALERRLRREAGSGDGTFGAETTSAGTSQSTPDAVL